jgi:hypothetical protein
MYTQKHDNLRWELAANQVSALTSVVTVGHNRYLEYNITHLLHKSSREISSAVATLDVLHAGLCEDSGVMRLN